MGMSHDVRCYRHGDWKASLSQEWVKQMGKKIGGMETDHKIA